MTNKLSKKLSTDIGIAAILNISQKLRTFLVIPAIVGSLGIVNYGIYAQVITVISISSFIFSLGLNGALIRYSQSDKYSQTLVFSTTLVCGSLSGIVIGSLVSINAMWLSNLLLRSKDFWPAFVLSGILIPTRIVFKLSESYFRSNMKTKLASALLTTRYYLSFLSILTTIYVFQQGIISVLTGVVLVELGYTTLLTIYIIYNLGLKLPNIDFSVKILRYSIPLCASNLANNLSTRVDRLLVGAYLGAEAIGVYDIAYRLSSVIMVYSEPIVNSYFPEFSRLIEKGRFSECGQYHEKGVKYFLIFAIPSIFGLDIISSFLVKFANMTNNTAQSERIMPILAIGISLWGLERLFSVILVSAEETRILSVVRGGGAAINILLNIILIPLLGLVGAALATISSYLLTTIIVSRYARNIIDYGIDLPMFLKPIFASVAMYSVIMMINMENILLTVTISVTTYFLILLSVNGLIYKFYN
jgi:O-antigen/teichoic acid export membrane protein